MIELVQAARQPIPLLFVGRMTELFEQGFLAALVVASAFEEGDEPLERLVGGHRQNAAVGLLKLGQRRLQQRKGRIGAAISSQGVGMAEGDVQSIEGTPLLLAVHRFQLAKLFLGQRSLRNRTETSEEIGHETRFAGRPFLLEGPLERGQRRLDVRAGLVFQLRRPSPDQTFEQIDRAAIHRRLGTLADFVYVTNEFIDGGFVANFAEKRLHSPNAEEGVNPFRRVSEDGVRQAGQQAEVVRRLIILLKQTEVLLRRTRLVQ